MRLLIIAGLLCGAFGLAVPPAAAADDTRVKANWKEHCTQCHGEDGRGRTAMGRKLKLFDYTDPKIQEKLKDDEMTKVIKEGAKQGSRVLMKPYEDVLNDEEIKELIVYIRKFKKE